MDNNIGLGDEMRQLSPIVAAVAALVILITAAAYLLLVLYGRLRYTKPSNPGRDTIKPMDTLLPPSDDRRELRAVVDKVAGMMSHQFRRRGQGWEWDFEWSHSDIQRRANCWEMVRFIEHINEALAELDGQLCRGVGTVSADVLQRILYFVPGGGLGAQAQGYLGESLEGVELREPKYSSTDAAVIGRVRQIAEKELGRRAALLETRGYVRLAQSDSADDWGPNRDVEKLQTYRRLRELNESWDSSFRVWDYGFMIVGVLAGGVLVIALLLWYIFQ